LSSGLCSGLIYPKMLGYTCSLMPRHISEDIFSSTTLWGPQVSLIFSVFCGGGVKWANTWVSFQFCQTLFTKWC
jgi:hypothetical protein